MFINRKKGHQTLKVLSRWLVNKNPKEANGFWIPEVTLNSCITAVNTIPRLLVKFYVLKMFCIVWLTILSYVSVQVCKGVIKEIKFHNLILCRLFNLIYTFKIWITLIANLFLPYFFAFNFFVWKFTKPYSYMHTEKRELRYIPFYIINI